MTYYMHRDDFNMFKALTIAEILHLVCACLYCLVIIIVITSWLFIISALKGPPYFLEEMPRHIVSPEDASLGLECKVASAGYKLTRKWYRDGTLLKVGSEPRLSISSGGRLEFSALKRTDSGVYNCKAETEAGYVEGTSIVLAACMCEQTLALTMTQIAEDKLRYCH